MHNYEQTIRKLKSLNDNEQQMAHRVRFNSVSTSEISQAQLQLNEDETLMEEKKRLSNFERIHEAVKQVMMRFKGEQKGLDWIGLVMGHMEDAA